MRDGRGCVVAMNEERLPNFTLLVATIDPNKFGELMVLPLSYPAIGGVWNGDSSSIVVNGDGGSDRLEEIDTALPNPLGRRMSSSDSSVSVGEWVPLKACHFMSDLALGNEARFGGRFLRCENKEETRLISRVGPDTLLLLGAIDDDRDKFSTGGGSRTGGTAGTGGGGVRRFGRKDIRYSQ